MLQSETKLLQELLCVVVKGGIEAASGNTAPTRPPASCQLATQVHSAAATPGKCCEQVHQSGRNLFVLHCG